MQINCLHQRNNYNISFSLENSLNVRCLKIEWRWIGQFADYELEWKHLSYARNMATNIFCYKNIWDGFWFFYESCLQLKRRAEALSIHGPAATIPVVQSLRLPVPREAGKLPLLFKDSFPKSSERKAPSTRLSSELLTFTWIKLRKENKTSQRLDRQLLLTVH